MLNTIIIQKEQIWKDIPGYEGIYQVSSFGNVKSLNYNRTKKERLLKPGISTNSYYNVNLYKNGKCRTFQVHQLVAICFLNHKPNGYTLVVNHIDNNQLNNYVYNLELVSPRYNSSCHRADAGVTKILNGKYGVKIVINKKQIHLGDFTDKKDALTTYQKAVDNIDKYNGNSREFRKLLNPDYEKDRGAYKTVSGKYQAMIRINNKNIHLGHFTDKEEANRMYQLASENTHLFNGNNKQFRELLKNIQK
jgi:hypothetical protein